MRVPLLVLMLLLAAALLDAPPGARAAAPPRVAIVFEHVGPSLSDLVPIYAMHKPFGLGIFPRMRYSSQIAREAAAHGLTPMLHIAMESRNPADMGTSSPARSGCA